MKRKDCEIILALEKRANKLFGKNKNKYRGKNRMLSITYNESIDENTKIALLKQIEESLEIDFVSVWTLSDEIKYKKLLDYRKLNADRINLSSRIYKKLNRDKYTAYNIKYQARKMKALPKWLTYEDFENMKKFYSLAKELTKKLGIKHHVDHIIPLQGKTVCGLHCPLNLRVVTAKENLSKSNKLIEQLLYNNTL